MVYLAQTKLVPRNVLKESDLVVTQPGNIFGGDRSTLTSKTEITYGFYNFSYGEDNNKVYTIGLCRGDVNPNDCRSCLNNSRVLLTQNCPNQKEAIGWIDKCMLRYSNRSIFGLMETFPDFAIPNPFNATDVDKYKQVVGKF